MRAAPAVSVPCRGGGGWRVFQALTVALAAAAVSAWALGHLDGLLWPAALVALGVGALAWRLVPDSTALLAWDGRQWTVDGSPGQLDVMLDLGPWLLLRVRPASGRAPRWLPVSAAGAGSALHALRAALYGRPPAVQPGDASSAHRALAEAD